MQRHCALLALVLLAAQHHTAAAIDASLWTLPDGFQVADYFSPNGTNGPQPVKARSLALSGNSKATGPVITYVSSVNLFGSALMSIYALVDLTGSGTADYSINVVDSISTMPNGIAWRNGSLFIASMVPYASCTVYRLDDVDKYALKQKPVPANPNLKVVLDHCPIDFWHGWKFIRFGPDGKLYMPIGSNCNACRHNETATPNNGYVDGQLIYNFANSQNVSYVFAPYRKNASTPVWNFETIYRFNPDGTGIEEFAKGMRNTVGFDWHPDTKEMYFTDNGRDDMGGLDTAFTDNHPDCELNYAPSKGLHFGYPYCHTGPAGDQVDARPYLRLPGVGTNEVDPQLNIGESQLVCNGANLKYKPAIQAFGPHMAPLGMRFYKFNSSQTAQFRKEHDRSIFAAIHGSWNRYRPIGAKVARIVLDTTNKGKVVKYESFMSGGVPGDAGGPDGPNPPVAPDATYNGRPVDVEQLPDGSLLVSDDFKGAVYRITYNGASKCHTNATGTVKKSGPGAGRRRQQHRTLLAGRRQAVLKGDDGKKGCGFGSEGPELKPEVVQGTAAGCGINMGETLGVARFRRCYRFDMTGQRDFLTLAFSLEKFNSTKYVVNAAIIGHDYANLNGNGWMALGVPKKGEHDMKGANAIMVRPIAGGALADDYYMGSFVFNNFTLSKGFLVDKANKLKAVVAGDALISTASFFLPAGQSLGSKLYLLFALGDVASDGTPLRHWSTAYARVDVLAADVGATVPATVPVLNTRGMKPATGPPICNNTTPVAPTNPCTVNGVSYDGCTTTSDGGMPYTHYYTYNAGTKTLSGAIKADTSNLGGTTGWAALAFTSGSGGMRGADTIFVMPCGGCASGARAETVNMAVYAYNQFVPTTAFSNVAASRLDSGELFVSFTTPWKPGTNGKVQVRYGGGPYSAATPTTGTPLKHVTYPAAACISPTGGLTSVGCGC